MTTITLDFKAGVDEAVKSIGKVVYGVEGINKSAKALNKDASGALQTFGVNLNALDNPITAVAQGMKAAIDETVKWAGDIDKLSRNTGLSATEASKFAIVAGDVGIEIGTLERALKAMTKDGLELNMASIKKLAKEYNALKSPVDRMKFATDHFGAAAQDMTEILSRSSEELDELAEAAEKSGRVMDEEAIANAEKFEQSLKQLDDVIKGLMVTVGNVAIPTILKAGETLQTEAKIAAVLAIEFQRMTGQIDYLEASQRAAAVAAGDNTAAFEEQIPVIHDVNERIKDTTFSEGKMTTQTAALNSVWQSYGPSVAPAVQANWEFQQTMEPLTGAASDLQFAMGELTTATIFHQAAQNLDADAALALGVKMGLVDEETLAAKQALDAAREAADKNKDGFIDAAEAAGGYSDAVAAMADKLNYAARQAAALNAQLASAMANGAGATAGGGVVAGGSGGYAEGTPGIMTVPQGYPRDSFNIPAQSGEQFAVAPAGVNLMDWLGAQGGGQVNNFYISSTDPRAAAQEVSRVLASQARQYKAGGAGAALGSR